MKNHPPLTGDFISSRKSFTANRLKMIPHFQSASGGLVSLLLRFTSTIFIAVCPGMIWAQPEHFEFDHLSVQDGLSHPVVTCILQDHTGFVWFGTLDGLNRFDGYNFTVYRHDPLDSNSLTNNIIGSLYEDKEGLLWVGTKGGGVNIFDPGTGSFHKLPLAGERTNQDFIDIINSIYADHSGTVWVGTNDGLVSIDPSSLQAHYYRRDTTNPNALRSNVIQAICENSDETFWIATWSNGLHLFDRTKGSFSVYEYRMGDPSGLSDANVISLAEASDRSFWIGTWMGGLNRFDKVNRKFVHYPKSTIVGKGLNDNTVRAISEDEKGRLWLATAGGGINIFDRKANAFSYITHDPSNPSSLAGRDVRALYRDRNGNLWIGTDDGINKLMQKKFGLLRPLRDDPKGLLSSEVSAMCEDHDGDVWVASYIVGLNRFRADGSIAARFKRGADQTDSLSSNFVIRLYADRMGNLWVGTAGGGLNRFDRERNELDVYRHDRSDPESLTNDFIYAIFEDHEGSLWIGTNEGLDRMESYDRTKKTFSHYRHESGNLRSIGDDNITALAEDTTGVLWAGTSYGGLSALDQSRKTFTRYTHDPENPGSLASNNVSAVYVDRSNRLWVGTASTGLDLFDPEAHSFAHFTSRDGLSNDAVRGIIEDTHGNLWIGTNNGLSRLDPSTKMFRRYDAWDGLQDNQVTACYRGASGKMYFGGPKGLNFFYPESLSDFSIPPSVILTSFRVFNEALPLPQPLNTVAELSLNYQQNFISFEFAALDYTAPEKNQYAYKLEGVDPDWTYSGTRHFANYTHLDPGKYIFRVQGSNSHGAWNKDGRAISIIITPPFWATWWFRSLTCIVAVGILAAAYKYRVHKLLELERMRLRIAGDLHDELGSNLSGIALASEMVQSSATLGDPERRRLHEIGVRALQTAEAMRDIVWFINPEHDKPGDIVLKMKDVASSVLNGVHFTFQSSENPLPKSSDIEVRRNIFLIYKETLNNIVRHSRCSAVDIRMENVDGNFVLRIMDNGIGFASHAERHGNGLKNIAGRAEQLGGQLNIESSPGQGTVMTFKMQTT